MVTPSVLTTSTVEPTENGPRGVTEQQRGGDGTDPADRAAGIGEAPADVVGPQIEPVAPVRGEAADRPTSP